MLNRLRHEERGLAMVVALMVSFVVLLLSTVVVAQSIHNGAQSAYDRRRLQSVGAAEAGLNYFFNYVEQTGAQMLASRCGVVTAGRCAGNPFTDTQPITVAVAPGTATFTITPTFYADTRGLTPFSGTITDSNYPHSVEVVSGGTTNGRTTRTMESFMSLTANSGGFKGAVVTNNTISLVNSFTISGNSANDGDIYVTCTTSPCNASVTSGLQTIKGNLYVPAGSITLSSSVHVYGDVWANGAVVINQSQVQVDGSVTSSTSSVDVSKGVVSGKGTYCTTLPSGASHIAGGTVKTCQGAPPTPSFPHLMYDDTVSPYSDATWRTGCNKSPVVDCYYLKTFGSVGSTASSDCVSARSYIEGTASTDFNGGAGVPNGYSGVVVRILSKCSYTPSNNKTISLGADLGIITNGSITFGSQSNWNGTGTTLRKMFLIIPWPQSVCSTTSSSSDYHDITVGNQSNFNSLVELGLYTPCTAHMSNTNAFYGQVVAGTVDIGNSWNMNYRPIVIPGALVTGFSENIAYIREIR
jgi:Tfp pilus assembly protein PilX